MPRRAAWRGAACRKALFHLVGQQRGNRERGDAVPARPHPVEDQGQVAAPDLGRQRLTGLALAHGYDTAFWWIAAILAGGAVVAAVPFRRGPLHRPGGQAEDTRAAETDPAIPA